MSQLTPPAQPSAPLMSGSYKPRVLLADDEKESFLKYLTLAVEGWGYEVVAVSDSQKAIELLDTRDSWRQEWFHAVVADLDWGPEGMDRTKESAGSVLMTGDYKGWDIDAATKDLIPTILLTQHDRMEHSSRLQRSHSYSKQASIPKPTGDDIRSKGIPFYGDLPGALYRIITETFNHELGIRYKGGLSALAIAATVHQEAMNDDALLIRLAHEIEDLLRRLFKETHEIVLIPLKYGGSGAAVIKAIEVRKTGEIGQSTVVKIGVRPDMERDAQNYKDHIGPVGSFTTRQEGYERTTHFGIIKYSMQNAEVDDSELFEEFYQSASDIKRIEDALGSLFDRTYAGWNALDKDTLKGEHLDTWYRANWGLNEQGDMAQSRALVSQQIDQIAQAAKAQFGYVVNRGNSVITFSKDGSGKLSLFPDPTIYLYDAPRQVHFEDPVSATTHGDLHGRNILIDSLHTLTCSLIDFGQTGKGPHYRDYVELEAVTVLQWSRVWDPSLLFKMSEVLVRQDNLGELALNTIKEAELLKPLRAVSKIRQCASRYAGGDMRHYYVGLLFQAGRILAGRGSFSPDRMRPQRLLAFHSLIFACHICGRLEGWKMETPTTTIVS